MATVPFVIERKVQYHGIWNTGLQVTDQFLKSIAQQFDTKPSCPTFITLNVNSITLVVLTRSGDKELHRDHIAFDALREIAVNSFNPRCLMILYINNKNKFSIIVCSCQDSKEAVNISLAYKQLKNYRLVNPNRGNHVKQNWTLKKSTRDVNGNVSETGDGDSISTRSRTESGVMNDTFAFLNNESVSMNGEDEDVFGVLEDVEREPVEGDDEEPKLFHAGFQVNLEDKHHGGGSVSSRSSIASLQSLQSLADEVKAIENDHWDPDSPGIGQSEFFKSESVEEPVEDENGADENDENDENDEERDEENETPKTRTVLKITKTDDVEEADFRSVSTQTVSGGILRRYKKKAGSVNTSNMYKEMAAQRKGGQLNGSSTNSINGSNGSVNGPTTTADIAGFTSSANGNFLRARGSSINSGVSYKSLFMPRQVQTSSKSVSRPIEDVYRSWSRSKRTEGQTRSRRVIVYGQQRH